jgi:hypothetical protein
MAEAGPLFVSPRAEQPVQRTLFAAQSPEMEEEEYDDASAGGKNIFGRLANVGKALASGRVEPRGREEVSPRKAEVREVAAQGQDEEEFYDIPAFLRRQAN